MVADRRGFLVVVAGLAASLASKSAWGTVNAVAVPFRLGLARMLINARIDGAPPVPLILDTGAHVSLLAEPFATRIKLRDLGRTPAIIAGTRDKFPLVEADSVVVDGGVNLGKVAFSVIPVPSLGDTAIGSISGGLITFMDSAIDFKNSRILLFPDGGPDYVGWTRHPKGVEKGRYGTSYINADATLSGVPMRLKLDTGSPGDLLLPERDMRRVDPDWKERNWTPFPAKGGFTRLLRLQGDLKIGDLTVHRPLVRLPNEDELFRNALVGLPVLQQMDIATRIDDRSLFTRANGLPAPKRPYNMSGLWVGRKDGALIAEAVGRGSPAAAAGIKVGDVLTGHAFSALIRLLNGPPGRRVSLGVAGRQVEFTLTDYL